MDIAAENQIPGRNTDSSKKLKKRIGENLREKRLEKNFTIEAIAKDTGLSKSTISRIENGESFDLDKIEMLAIYYCIPVNEVFTRP